MTTAQEKLSKVVDNVEQTIAETTSLDVLESYNQIINRLSGLVQTRYNALQQEARKLFAVGSRVKVHASDGSYQPGTITKRTKQFAYVNFDVNPDRSQKVRFTQLLELPESDPRYDGTEAQAQARTKRAETKKKLEEEVRAWCEKKLIVQGLPSGTKEKMTEKLINDMVEKELQKAGH